MWIITQDRIDDGKAVGTRSDNCPSDEPITEGKTFRMLDDDGIVYYVGRESGGETGFEPLDEFGMPNAGCTSIEYFENGKGWQQL